MHSDFAQTRLEVLGRRFRHDGIAFYTGATFEQYCEDPERYDAEALAKRREAERIHARAMQMRGARCEPLRIVSNWIVVRQTSKGSHFPFTLN